MTLLDASTERFHKRCKDSGLKPPFFKIGQNTRDESLELQLKPEWGWGDTPWNTLHHRGAIWSFQSAKCAFWDRGRKPEYPGKRNPGRADVLVVAP